MSTTSTGGQVAAAVRMDLEPRREEMVDLLRQLVQIESPSDDRPSLERFASALQELFSAFGPISDTETPRGRHLLLSIPAHEADARPAVALCHYDTVWPLGTLERIPFSVENDVARGPGCFDMKAGIVLLYFALQRVSLRRPLKVLFTCDEEVGSPTSRALIDETAQGAEVAYVLESPLPGGTLKTARKGTGDYVLKIEGRAAHAGVEPQKGISAVHELAQQILALHALNNYEVGTTVNVGVVEGGTRPNVVAAAAEAKIDVRVSTLAEGARLDAAIRGLTPSLHGAKLSIEGGLGRPPMERSAAMGELFKHAQQIAAAMGVDIDEGSTGGGSDGNFTAALGIPTLDGLGAEGDGAHAAHEHVLVDSLPRRAALLAGLLAEV